MSKPSWTELYRDWFGTPKVPQAIHWLLDKHELQDALQRNLPSLHWTVQDDLDHLFVQGVCKDGRRCCMRVRPSDCLEYVLGEIRDFLAAAAEEEARGRYYGEFASREREC